MRKRLLKRALLALALCGAMLGASGCWLGNNGFIYEDYNGKIVRVGEWAKYPPGQFDYQVVFWRRTGGDPRNFPTSQALLELWSYYHHNWGMSDLGAAAFLLTKMRDNCSGSAALLCQQALSPSRYRNFFFNSLVPLPWKPDACISLAYLFFESSGTREFIWSHRSGTHHLCKPGRQLR